jgi:hypothetical protein
VKPQQDRRLRRQSERRLGLAGCYGGTRERAGDSAAWGRPAVGSIEVEAGSEDVGLGSPGLQVQAWARQAWKMTWKMEGLDSDEAEWKMQG